MRVAAFARWLQIKSFIMLGKYPLLLIIMALLLRMVMILGETIVVTALVVGIIGMTTVVTALGTKAGLTMTGVTVAGVTVLGKTIPGATMPAGDQATLRPEITARLTGLLHVNTIPP